MFAFACFYGGDERFYSRFVLPAVHRLVDPEAAHNLAVWAAKHRLFPKERGIKGSMTTDMDLVSIFIILSDANVVQSALAGCNLCRDARELDVAAKSVERAKLFTERKLISRRPTMCRR